MENEEGYKLFITPHTVTQSMQVCSQNTEGKLHCWVGSPTPDGGYDIEKCVGENKPAPAGLLNTHMGQWYDKTKLLLLQCEKSGERVLGYSPWGDEQRLQAINLAANGKVDDFVRFDGTSSRSALFLNYACGIKNNFLSCKSIDKIPSHTFNLWTVGTQGIPVDMNTQNIFAGFALYAWDHPSFVYAIHDGVCVNHKDGFRCRHFIFDGDKAIAMDFDSDNAGWTASAGLWNIAYQTQTGDRQNTLYVQTWHFEKQAETYPLAEKFFVFTGGLLGDRIININDFFYDERILCFSSIGTKGTRTDYDDPEYNSGASKHCMRLNEKYQMTGDIESALPLNQKDRIQKVGRALCLIGNQIICDFPALSPRLFEHPFLSIDARSHFIDTHNGYICSAEADSAICYDVKEPGPLESLKKLRFAYKGLSKEFMLSRDINIRRFDPYGEPWICTVYPYSIRVGNQYVHTCESAGSSPQILQIYEDYESAPEPDDTDTTPARVRTPRHKKPRKSRDTSLRDYYARTLTRGRGYNSPYFQSRSTRDSFLRNYRRY
jgi:hypothetical protein